MMQEKRRKKKTALEKDMHSTPLLNLPASDTKRVDGIKIFFPEISCDLSNLSQLLRFT